MPRSLRPLSPSASLRSAAYRKRRATIVARFHVRDGASQSVTSGTCICRSLDLWIIIIVTIINGLLTTTYKCFILENGSDEKRNPYPQPA